jgi:hypothetical protein
VDTELTLFLDDDAVLGEGALGRLLADLDAHPEAVGVSALVVRRDGIVQHCGGWLECSGQAARFGLRGAGLPADDPRVPATGPSDWLPGTAALIRTSALREVPIDPGLNAYYEDNDWSLSVQRRWPGSFRSCREAVVVHANHDAAVMHSCELARVSWLAERLASQARFMRRHGVVLDIDLAQMVPALVLPGGNLDLPAARLLLELVASRGTDWLVSEWMGGRLEPLFVRGPLIARLQHESARHAAELGEVTAERDDHSARVQQLEIESAELREHIYWLRRLEKRLESIESGGWWRLRGQLQPVLRVATRGKRLLDNARAR